MGPPVISAHCGILTRGPHASGFARPPLFIAHPLAPEYSTAVIILISHAEWASHLQRPALAALQSLCTQRWPQPLESARDTDRDSPLERWRARALGLPTPNSGIAWGAWYAAQLGADAATPAALISPCHWDINMTGVRMDDPAQLWLSDADSQALMDALKPLAEEDGIALTWLNAQHWLARGAVFAQLPSASPAALAGQDLDAHLPQVPHDTSATRLLRRLQNEAQMLFYSHPVHDRRHAQRLPAVNSIWYHGTGRLEAPPAGGGVGEHRPPRAPFAPDSQPTTPNANPLAERNASARAVTELSLLEPLRETGDLATAWQRLDAQVGALLQQHPDAECVMCNARGARHWSLTAPPWWQRWRIKRPTHFVEALP